MTSELRSAASRLLLSVSIAVACVLTAAHAAAGDPTIAGRAAPPAKLVLVVANNRGAELGRPELHYADDDGAKYRALFRAASAAPGDVQLLARFDRDTSRLFTEPPDGAPTRAAVEQKVAVLIARRAELRREGREVDLVFVFAGHGDIDRGKGFIQLEDGAFTADDLAALVRRVDATRAHVILDSCNSLFLVSPRKPGGRHVATADDAVRALHDRLPRVGVFLSTSADGEVFEWSELGAGIFSHAVRSGLAGAADADGNGEVSYAELRAFVDVATKEVKNPRYRPQVFAHGPDGDDRIPLFAPRQAQGRRLVLEGPVRTTLRDADDIPWVDAHVETGARVELLVPAPLDEGRGTQEILDVSEGSPRVVKRVAIDETASTRPQPVAARGSNDLFRMLFAQPFGPAAYAAETATPTSVQAQGYGLSRDDITRFSTLLAHVAETERSRRRLGGLGLFAAGVASGGMGGLLLARDRDDGARTVGLGLLSTGIGLVVAAPLVGFRSGPGEKLQAEMQRDVTTSGNPSAAIARAESRLFDIAKTERTYRLVGAVGLGATFAASGVGFAFNELRQTPNDYVRGVLASGMLFSAVGSFLFLQPTPIETLAEVWRAEPSRPVARWTFSPVGPAGLGGSVSGSF